MKYYWRSVLPALVVAILLASTEAVPAKLYEEQPPIILQEQEIPKKPEPPTIDDSQTPYPWCSPEEALLHKKFSDLLNSQPKTNLFYEVFMIFLNIMALSLDEIGEAIRNAISEDYSDEDEMWDWASFEDYGFYPADSPGKRVRRDVVKGKVFGEKGEVKVKADVSGKGKGKDMGKDMGKGKGKGKDR